MGRIFKYDFGPIGRGIKTITANNPVYQILDIQEQDGNLVMWVTVGDKTAPHDISMEAVWTGESTPNKTYFKTIQDSDGLVYHIFI